MQVGTTLPTGGLLGVQGRRGREPMEGLGLTIGPAISSTCRPAPPEHAQSKCVLGGPSRLVQTPGRFYLPDY